MSKCHISTREESAMVQSQSNTYLYGVHSYICTHTCILYTLFFNASFNWFYFILFITSTSMPLMPAYILNDKVRSYYAV